MKYPLSLLKENLIQLKSLRYSFKGVKRPGFMEKLEKRIESLDAAISILKKAENNTGS